MARRDRDEEWQVYALATGPLPRRIRVAGRSIHVLRVGSVAVAVGTPLDLHVEEGLRDQHAIVIALAQQFDPILPVRFGARMTRARIAQVIEPSAGALLRALAHVRGRQQVTLRLMGPLAPAISPATSGTEYLARRLAAQAFPPETSPLQDAVRPFVVDQRIHPGRGGIRLTVFHLVNKESAPAYIRAAQSVAAKIDPWRVSISGPWPPFAFGPELSQ